MSLPGCPAHRLLPHASPAAVECENADVTTVEQTWPTQLLQCDKRPCRRCSVPFSRLFFPEYGFKWMDWFWFSCRWCESNTEQGQNYLNGSKCLWKHKRATQWVTELLQRETHICGRPDVELQDWRCDCVRSCSAGEKTTSASLFIN